MALVFDVLLGLALLDFEQRRLGDVNVASLNEFDHLPIEERQQESSDV
jgi:hypothetical protein